MRKKVLFIVTKSGMGGAGRAVFDLSTNLTGEINPIVAAGEEGGGELLKKLQEAGIRTTVLPALGRDIAIWSEVRSFFALLSLMRREQPDTVHLHSPKAGGLGALAARVVGIKKIIYTAHGWAFFEDRPWYQKIIIKLFSYLTVLLSTKTIAVSKKDTRAFDRWPFTKNKVTHIPNGVNVSASVSYEEARKKLGLEPGVFVVGTIAELHKNKGLSYLAEAAEKIPNATFAIIGEGEERKRLALAIAAHRLEKRVLLLGYIPNARTLISAFDIFILPSIKEGLPYVLLEAGARGIPTVATNVGGIPEIIEHKKTGLLVEPKDPSALAEALNRLIGDESLRKKLGASLKQKIQRNFSLDVMVRKTIALYKN